MSAIQTIEGLASNLNISDIVDKIITYERTPVTYLEQDKELKTKQAAAYKAVLAKLIALKTQVSLLRKKSSFNLANITVSDESVLSATASGPPVVGSYNVRVLSLARNHQLASQGFDDFSANVFGTGTIRLSLGQSGMRTINIEEGSNSLLGIKDAINQANTGITASIINDGSSSRPYRLLLTGSKSGACNDINFEISLSGGETLDFTGSTFDNPEELSVSSASTSQISLGSTASYAGNVNKIYTFTVAGAGTQTIGTDNITINWTDGTNSGSILVTQADTELELIGEGSDGLKLSFTAGNLVAGDTFQVATFAPVLQAAADARIAIGDDGSGTGSAITINSPTNSFDDVLPGLTLNVNKISDPGEMVTIKSDIDSQGIKSMVEDLITKYNDVMDFIDDQFSYNSDTSESGVLFADYSLQVMQAAVRSAATFVVKGLGGGCGSLSSLGIRTAENGRLQIVNSATLMDAIINNMDNFVNLFVDSAVASSSQIEFMSMSSDTVPGEDYAVNITHAATKGYFQGSCIANPAAQPLSLDNSNNIVRIQVEGVVSNDLVLSPREYNSGRELAEELQAQIDADSKLAGRSVTAEWVDLGDEGYLKITSGLYGSQSKVLLVTSVANSAYAVLGLTGGAAHSGDDVEGTINGEKATGKGQTLTGDEGNSTTAGLKLKITLAGNQLLAGGPEGMISISRGLASKLDGTLENITKSVDGSIARRTSSLDKQIESITKQIAEYEERLERRRESLYEQFNAMEEALAQYQSEGTYLETQLSNLSANWATILGNNRK
jgi:flagellar hook-associated protein 2